MTGGGIPRRPPSLLRPSSVMVLPEISGDVKGDMTYNLHLPDTFRGFSAEDSSSELGELELEPAHRRTFRILRCC